MLGVMKLHVQAHHFCFSSTIAAAWVTIYGHVNVNILFTCKMFSYESSVT